MVVVFVGDSHCGAVVVVVAVRNMWWWWLLQCDGVGYGGFSIFLFSIFLFQSVLWYCCGSGSERFVVVVVMFD